MGRLGEDHTGSQRIAMRTGSETYLLFGDHLASSILLVRGEGTVAEKAYYLPWGGTRGDETITSTAYAYTGQMREGNIYYYGARWYDPSIGRFMQADTIVPLQVQGTQAFDRYAYVNNNPVNGTDPTGNYSTNIRLSDGGGVGIEGLFNEAYRKFYNKEPPEYSLRSEWSSWTPGSWNSTGGEGIFNEQSNTNGWKSYGLLPNRPPLNKILQDIVVHHIGDFSFGIGINNDLGLMKALESSEQVSWYYDVAYHYGIGPAGEVFVGRNIGTRGAHVEGGNTGRVGVVLLGTFDSTTAPSDMMVKSLTALSVALSDLYGVKNIVGHRELNQTLCPGDSTMQFIEQIQRVLLSK
jgi:RHS repeat-associated protein